MVEKPVILSNFDNIMDEYTEQRVIYDQLTKKVENLIKNLLIAENFPIHSITSRTKGIKSLGDKIEKEEKQYEKLIDITDLSGVRIICFFSEDVDIVAEIIKRNFKVNDELSVDKREILDPDKFGYVSLHYIIEISEDRENLPEYKQFKGLTCEIQIRSILQHAWAEIEHDLGYKSISGIPKDIRRKFSRLAGLLELADEQFVFIRHDIEKYGEKIESLIKHSYEGILIDNITLKSYILISEDVQNIQFKSSLIRGIPLAKKIDMGTLEKYNKICKFHNILTISDLNENIKQNEEKIIDLLWFLENKTMPSIAQKRSFFSSKHIKELQKTISSNLQGQKQKRSVSLGFVIWMLGYVLLCDRKDVEYKRKYLKIMNLDKVTDLENRLIEFCEKNAKK